MNCGFHFNPVCSYEDVVLCSIFYECFMLHIFISFLQYLKWVFSLNVYLSNEFKLVIFWNNFGRHRSTDTPVLDFWWVLARFQKQGETSLECFLARVQCISQIHLWYNSCEHYSRAVLITYLYKLVILNLDSQNFWLWWRSLFPRQIAPCAVFGVCTYCLDFWGLSSFLQAFGLLLKLSKKSKRRYQCSGREKSTCVKNQRRVIMQNSLLSCVRTAIRFLYQLLAALALIVVQSICRVTCVALSPTHLYCACTCIKEWCFCTRISVPCT